MGIDYGVVILEESGSFKGKVSLADESDYSGIDVYIPGTSFSTKTEQDGSYLLEGIPEGVYTLKFSKTGYTTKTISNIVKGDEAITPVLEVELLSSISSLDGSVVFENLIEGSSVPETLITVTDLSNNSVVSSLNLDGQGKFSISEIPLGLYRITIIAEGFKTYTEDLLIEGNIILAPIKLTLDGGSVSGFVKGFDNAGLESVFVQVTSKSNPFRGSALTSKDGSYTITGLYPGENDIEFIKAGYPTIKETINIVKGETLNYETVKMIPSSAVVSGRVILKDSADNSGVTITLKHPSNVVFSTTSSADGLFLIDGINVTGNYLVAFAKTGYVGSTSSVSVTDLGKVYTLPDESLSSLYSNVSGVVKLPDSSDSTGVLLNLETEDGTGSYTASSTSSGSYIFKGVLPGSYTLTATKAGYDTTSITGIIVEQSTDKSVDMFSLNVKSRYITGQVNLQNTDNHAGINVIATCTSDTSKVYSAITNSKGDFYIQNLEPAEYIISISKDGYSAPNDITVDLRSTFSKDLGSVNLSILKASVSGKVELYGSANHAGVNVSITHSISKDSYTYITESDGTFLIDDILEAGSYVLHISKDGYVTPKPETIEIANGRVTDIGKIELRNINAIIKGSVTLYNQSLSSGIVIRLESADGSIVKNTESGSDGSYFLSDIVPGVYNITFTKDKYDEVSIKGISVEQSEMKILDGVVLNAKTRTIKGNVLLEGSSNHSGIEVSVCNVTTSMVYEGQTNSDGGFSIQNLDAGEYSVSFKKNGYVSPEPIIVNLSDSLEKTIEQVTLKIRNANVAGKVELVGSSIQSGALVHITHVQTGDMKSTETLSDGSFIITDIALSGTYTLKVSAEGFITSPAKNIEVISGSATDVGTIKLESAYSTVKGVAKLSGMTNFEGISVKLLQSGSVKFEKQTDATGAYEITLVPAGTYRIEFFKDGYSSVVLDIVVEQASEKNIPEVELAEKSRTISGIVLLENATIHQGITVTATNIADKSKVYSTQTNNSGAYYLLNIIPGIYSIEMNKDGYIPPTAFDVDVFRNGEVVVENMVLTSNKSIVTGIVKLKDKVDSSGVLITLTHTSGQQYQGTSNADGSFKITNISMSGNFSVSYYKEGCVAIPESSITIDYGSTNALEPVELVNYYSALKGKITLEGVDVAANSGVIVLLQSITDSSLAYTASTASDGSYAFPSVCPGEYTLIASMNGYSTASVSDIVVESTIDYVVDPLVLSIATRPIHGKITKEFSSDYSGAMVTATNISDPNIIYIALTNTEGRFTLAGVESGEYNIAVSAAGFLTHSYETVEVSASAVTLPEVELKVTRGTITGIVRPEGFIDCKGTTVELVGTQFSTVTDSNGVYTFSVPSGFYPGGLRFVRHNYKTEAYGNTIALNPNSVYSVDTVELIATHVSPITGKVIVKGFDSSEWAGIPVEIEGLEGFTTTTGVDGVFNFADVPIRELPYSIRIQKENAPLKVVNFEAVPADGIDLGTIEIIPNAANVEGYVDLVSIDDNSGVTVKAVEKDTGITVTAKTDSNGYFLLTNIASGETHTISFEKEGWNSQKLEISGLQPLEIRTLDSVALTDTTAPILNSVLLNGGTNTITNETEVSVTLSASDKGSGTAFMQYSFDGRLDNTVEMRPYDDEFIVNIPQGNGKKTIYVHVYDAAGNKSEIVTQSIELTDSEYKVSGILGGDDLTWTKANSPYVVTQSVKVSIGDTLTIEPGVDVKFIGDSYIHNEGTIIAKGTEAERIKFYSKDLSQGEWAGIDCRYDNPSIFSYVDIKDASNGIYGYADVDNANIEASGFAIGCKNSGRFSALIGNVDASIIKGNVFVMNINSSIISGNLFSSGIVKNVIVEGDLSNDHGYVDNVIIEGMTTAMETTFNNSKIKGGLDSQRSSFTYCTISRAISSNTDVFVFDKLENIFSVTWHNSPISYSDFILANDVVINVSTLATETKSSLIMRDNFWGDINTRKIQEAEAEGKTNLSFINDGNDDFNKVIADYSGYRESSVTNAGYYGDSIFTPVDTGKTTYSIGDIGQGGGMIFYVDTDGHFSDWDYLETYMGYYGIGEYTFGYYRPDGSTDSVVGTDTAIGSGKANTEALVAAMGDVADSDRFETEKKSLYAAKAADSYISNGYDDWFLPSRDELKLVHENIYKAGLCDFHYYYFWSSSEYDESRAWCQYFDYDSTPHDYWRNEERYIRPIRAF